MNIAFLLRSFLFTSAVILLSVTCHAQGNAVKTDSEKTKTDSVKIKRAQSLFAEICGPGLVISANYDTRFNNTRKGLGARVGIGYY
ncbi:MAG: hypothetical protein EOP47_30305, partial [Sphingobacteriaceae bacterium]